MTESSGKLERYVPEHPLPEAVRTMDRDETVCKFCGVSYLIHNEIKALEDKLKAVQDELQHYKGCEAREDVLKKELSGRDKTIGELNKTIHGKDAVLGTLKSDVKTKEEENIRIQNAKKDLENTLAETVRNLETYKLQHGFLMSNLPSIISQVAQLRSMLSTIKSEQTSYRSVLASIRQQMEATVTDMCSKLAAEYGELKGRVLELDNERLSYKFKEEKYIKDIASYEAQCQKLQSQNSNEVTQIQHKYDQLWIEYSGMQTDVKDLQDKLNSKDLENLQMKDKISSQVQTIQKLQSECNQHSTATEQAAQRQQKELKEKEGELQAVVRELGRMKKKFLEKQEEIEKKNSLSDMRSSSLQEEVLRMRGDCDALRREREMMIDAHQNQIEQLRESFKRKLSMNDNWQEKLDAAIRKEREQHAGEVAALEARLKENFVMELQIEKQKHQELLDKYKREQLDGTKELLDTVNSLRQQLKSAESEFHRQLAEHKARFRETENSMREEINSLKKIIRDLEQRLSRFDSGSDTRTSELKHDIKRMEAEVAEAKDQTRRLEGQLASAKEEVGFLQETVRRECEERFELTETLSVLKEKLMALEKPPGGYTPQRAPSSVSSVKSTESSRTVTSMEEMAVFRKITNRLPPHAPQSPRQPPLSKDKQFSSASAVTLGYNNGTTNAESDLKRTGGRNSSIGSSRDRISHAVGRR